jgi:hypothetical protein
MNTLEILINPNFNSTRDSIGLSEDQDNNSDAVLFQQGYDMDVLEVEQGDNFEIDNEFEGQINCEETQYKFIKLKKDEDEEWEDDDYEEGDSITLQPGKYKFLEDGITIEEIN